MKNRCNNVAIASPLLLIVIVFSLGTGCGQPKLARGRFTPEQQRWVSDFQRWYPGWEPPYVAPVRHRRKSTKSPGLEAPPWREPADEPAPAMDSPEDAILVPAEAPPSKAGKPESYTVEKGDTLSRIALQFYGDASEWKRIWRANRDILESPHKLFPGTVLEIPAEE